MSLFGQTSGREGVQRAWPILLIVVVAVLVPTASLLWFMGQSLENERDAGRQRLWQAYRGQLEVLRSATESTWEARVQSLETLLDEGTPAEVFADAVRSGGVATVILYDEDGRPLYPDLGVQAGRKLEGTLAAEWTSASRLEHKLNDAEAAEQAYLAIASHADDAEVEARAHQARARCFLKMGRKDQAIEVLVNTLDQPRYRGTFDEQGRAIQPAARLLTIEMLESDALDTIANVFAEDLRDYADVAMPARQRRFLMNELRHLAPRYDFDTLAAEELAAGLLERNPQAPEHSHLTPVTTGVWQVSLAGGRMRALFSEESLRAEVLEAQSGKDTEAASSLARSADILVLGPGESAGDQVFASLPLGEHLPGWQVAVSLKDSEQFETQAREKRLAYLTTGALIAVVMIALAVFAVGAVHRQVRLTRLKNDLLATVSHELKTPLSSMRLLVETLLESDELEPSRVREYLGLISKENARLSRLIESFLTFSRLERDGGTLERSPEEPRRLASEAVDAVADRFRGPSASLEVQIEPDLPDVRADREAFVTVLINLLDNAWKYSGEQKRVTLRAFREGADVCFSVQDNGIGLSAGDQERIFERFFQVDQRLVRAQSGVGLGLAIVKQIVRAHDGAVSVTSETGVGSTFVVRLPAERAPSTMGRAAI